MKEVIRHLLWLALENSKHFVTPEQRLVTPRSDVCVSSLEILCRWCVSTKILVVFLIQCKWCCVGKLLQSIRSTTQIWVVTCLQYGISAFVPQMSKMLCGGILKMNSSNKITIYWNSLSQVKVFGIPVFLFLCVCSGFVFFRVKNLALSNRAIFYLMVRTEK